MPKKNATTKPGGGTQHAPASEFSDDTQVESNAPQDVPPRSDGDPGRANETGESAKERRKRGKG